jgi:hypothetical protein
MNYRQLLENKKGTCIWSRWEVDSDVFSTSCENDFRLDEGTPLENGMKFCCFCGRPVEEYLEISE